MIGLSGRDSRDWMGESFLIRYVSDFLVGFAHEDMQNL